MEIANLLNLTWRRVVILVSLIGLGGAVGTVIAAGQPSRYDGNATIVVSNLVGIDQPDYLGQSYSKSIRDLVLLDGTLQAAGKTSGIDVDGATIEATVDDGGTTITVDVTLESAEVGDLAVALGRAAVDAAARQQVPFAERGLELAQVRLDESIAALERFDVTNGTNIADDPELPQAERDRRADLRIEREQLARAVDTAQRRVDDATGRLTEAKLFADQGAGRSTVVPGSVEREATTKGVLRTAGAGAAAGLAIGLGLLILLEASRRRNAERAEPNAASIAPLSEWPAGRGGAETSRADAGVVAEGLVGSRGHEQ